MRAKRHQLLIVTIFRRIASFGLYSYCPNQRLPLTAKHKAAMLAWCQVRRDWVHQWNAIVFTDRSRFSLCVNNGGRRKRRYRKKEQNFDFTERPHTDLTPSAMV